MKNLVFNVFALMICLGVTLGIAFGQDEGESDGEWCQFFDRPIDQMIQELMVVKYWFLMNFADVSNFKLTANE